jgi:two-component system sensor histidine kinase ChiS
MSGQVIVIIDDEPSLVEMLSIYLRMKGFETRSANTGQDGLTLVQVENPALLLLDLMLPDFDGYQVCRQLRAMSEFAHLPILVVSAHVEQTIISRAEQAGANGYMTKPIRLPELLGEINRLLSLSPAT